MAEDNGTGSNAVWAIALVIVVAIIGAIVYYSGALRQVDKKTDVDVQISAPGR